MTYEKLKTAAPEAFKRYCGVQPTTFATMLEVLRAGQERKKKSGRPSKLTLEDQLLMTLTY